MAGTKAYIIEQTNFDPREITLEDFLKLYETESTEVGNRKNQSWGNKIRKNPVYKDFLTQPVINILDAKTQIDGANIYKAAQDAEKTAKGDLQSKLRVLENNVLPKIREIQAREGIDLSRFTSLTETVPKIATAGQKLTATVQFDSNKMGELVANLEDHVKKNPLDRPKANAILLMLEMGARPSLPTEIISSDYVTSTVTPEAEMLGVGVRTDGLHIPAERKGVKRQAGGQTPNVQPFNAPLSQRAITILQDQSQYNARTFDPGVRLENFFQILETTGEKKGLPRPLDLDRDINTLLKLVTPPGTVRKLKSGKFVPTNDPLTSKNFRTIWTNIANNALNDPAKIAALQSRDVGTNTGSVAVYLGQAGDYQPAAVADLNEISKKSWGLYTLRDNVGKQQFSDGKLLSTSTFLFDTSPDERVYEVFGQGQAANVPIQVGGFSAPTADPKPASAVPTPAPVEKPAPTNFDELFAQNPELRSAMEKAGFEFKPEPAPAPEPEPTDVKPTGSGKKILKTLPYVGTAAALAAMPDVAEAATSGLEKVGLPKSIAEPVGAAAAAVDFGIGTVLPLAPSDVVDIGGAVVGEFKKSREESRGVGPRGRNLRSQKLREKRANEGFIPKP